MKDIIKVQILYDPDDFFYDYDRIDSVSYFKKWTYIRCCLDIY